MTLVKYRNDFPDLIDQLFGNGISNMSRNHFSNTNTTLPSVNITESNDSFEVEVAAPGFEKSDFNIELDNDVLTISSDKESNNTSHEDEKVTRQEFSYLSFKRSFSLPELVENDKISATYENGILNISIPKKEEAKPKPIKQIEIK